MRSCRTMAVNGYIGRMNSIIIPNQISKKVVKINNPIYNMSIL